MEPDFSNKEIISTAFRFVTVRNPKYYADSDSNSANANFTNAGTSLFLNALRTIINNGDLDAPAKLAQLRSTADDYLAAPSLYSELSALEAVTSGYPAFYEWLETNQDSLDHAILSTQTANLTALNGNTQDQLWERLIAMEITGQGDEYYEILYLVLLVNAFLLSFAQTSVSTTPAEFRDMARKNLVLPGDIFPLPGIGIIPPTDPAPPVPSPVPQAVEDALTQLQSYQDAAEEIRELYDAEVEIREASETLSEFSPQESLDANGDPLPLPNFPPDSPTSGYFLDEDARAQLSAPTLAILNALNIGTKVRFSFALDRIQQAMVKINNSAFADLNMEQQVISIGGALWTQNNEFSNAEVNNGVNSSSEEEAYKKPGYQGFYGDQEVRITPLVIGDLRRVETKLCCYVPGEVAHIENVMQGEYKEHSTRQLNRQENSFSESSQTESTLENEENLSDRFALENEIAKTIQRDTSFKLGISHAKELGPVKFGLTADIAHSTSQTQSNRQALNYAKDLTERSLSRMIQKISRERSRKVTEEFEVNNRHGLDNRAGTGHVVGLYRWVDKIYEGRIVNYGKRLMFEFFVPEPGAFHLWAMTQSSDAANYSLKKPIDPRSNEVKPFLGTNMIQALRNHTLIHEHNYGIWAAAYGAQVAPPPKQFITTGMSFSKDGMNGSAPFAQSYQDLVVPSGYVSESFIFNACHAQYEDSWIGVALGQERFATQQHMKKHIVARGYEGAVPFAIYGRTKSFTVGVRMTSQRKKSTLEDWQIETYNTIIQAFEQRKAEYEAALDKLNSQTQRRIQGNNPATNRAIEINELKKGCLRWLHYDKDFHKDAYGNTRSSDPCSPPEFQTTKWIIHHSRRVKLLESGFDWELMTYQFYPYFWGGKCRWKKLYQLEETDPLFLSFLQAGYARVLVPVQPGFESAILHFLATGHTWSSPKKAYMDSPFYKSVMRDLQDVPPTGQAPVEEDLKWEIRVPTSLTVLQCNSGCIAGEGLPCDCGTGIGTTNNPLVGSTNSSTSP